MNREIVRYIIAGGMAFAADFAVLYACTEFLHMHYLVSNVFGYFAGLLLTYMLNTRWVFDYRRYRKRTLLEFVLFNLIVVAGLGLSQVLMLLLVDVFALHYLTAKIAASVVITVFNYVAKKFILFHPTRVSGTP